MFKWILKNAKTSAAHVCQHDTRNWEELVIRLYRSDLYHGLFKEPSQKQFTFLPGSGGMDFILNVLATDDINGEVDLLCYKLPATDPLFTLRLNLSSVVHTSKQLTCGVEQSSLYQKLLSREEVNVNLQSEVSIGGAAITAPAPKIVALPGMEIFLESEWHHIMDPPFSTSLTVTSNGDPAGTPGTFYQGIIQAPTKPVKVDVDEAVSTVMYKVIEVEPLDWRTLAIAPLLNVKKNDFVFTGSSFFNVDFSFAGTVGFGITGLAGSSYSITGQLVRKFAYGQDLSTALEVVMLSIPFSGTDHVDVALAGVTYQDIIFLNPDEMVWSWWEVVYVIHQVAGVGPLTPFVGINITPDDENSEWFKININSTYGETNTYTYPIHEVFNQVTDAIADSNGNFYSEYYGRTDSEKQTYAANGKGALKGITNGNNIRNRDKPVYANFKELFQNANALDNIGMGIVNGKVRIEPKEFFYNRNTRLFTLPNVNAITVKLAPERYINKIEIGYETWEAEFKNGLGDVHAKQEYSTRVNSVKGTYTQLSTYLASTYAIEATRRKNVVDSPTTDWRYDNNNFWLALRSDYAVELVYDAFTSPAGMSGVATALNLRLTPKRMLLAHFNAIAAGLQKIKGFVAFTKGDGNTLLNILKTDVGSQEDYNGLRLHENGSQPWNDSNIKNVTPIFEPVLYSCSYPLTAEQYAAMEANPYGYVELYETEDEILRGFIIDAGYNIKTGKTDFTLIKRYEP